MDIKLGNIKEIDLREVWKHEATDFTNWLAQEQNLSLLSDEIGIDIALVKTEAGVGDFKVDILAEEEENTERKIIIENQLEITDHDHLGKIVTYASGYDASIIIWIVKNVRDEHRQAIDWLNEHTDEGIYFFIIKMELWQIEESLYAPKFQVISKPNDWVKTIKKEKNSTNLTDARRLQLEFWDQFKEYAISKSTNLKLRNTSPQNWYDISIGVSGAHISLSVSVMYNLLNCEIYISDNKKLFYALRQNKEKIEEELKEKLNWMELSEKKASRIRVSKDVDIENHDEWARYFEWLKIKAEKLNEIFPKYIKEINKNYSNDSVEEEH